MANSLSFSFSHKIVIGTLFCLPILSASADTTVIGLENLQLRGNQSYNTWNSLNNMTLEGTGAFMIPQAWEGDDGESGKYSSQQSHGGTSAFLSKPVGTANIYAGDDGLYFGGFSTTPNTRGGELNVTGSVITGVQTLAFQLEMGVVWDYVFYDNAYPTLTVTFDDLTTQVLEIGTGNNQGELLDHKENGFIAVPGGTEAKYVDLYGFQWDLSQLNGSVVSYMISFVGVQHSQVLGMRVDQSSYAYGSNYVFIPEPSVYALLLGAGALGVIAVRRRNRAK